MTDLSVANTIAQQIGGRAFFMLGTKNKIGTENSLIFDIKGSKKANKIEIIYDRGPDSYTVNFHKATMKRMLAGNTLVYSTSDIYADQLKDVIETHTGLYLSL
jgi:hypothetical protein